MKLNFVFLTKFLKKSREGFFNHIVPISVSRLDRRRYTFLWDLSILTVLYYFTMQTRSDPSSAKNVKNLNLIIEYKS